MSLIIDMLKDLEKRGTQEKPYSPLPIGDISDGIASINQYKIILAFTLFVLLATAMYALRMHYRNDSHPAYISSAKTTAVNTPFSLAANPKDAAWLAPVNITGITLQSKENITEVVFMLNHPALYEISTNSINNQLSITFENAQLEAEVPPEQFLNDTIHAINSSNKQSNVRFNVTYNPNTSVKYINLNTDEKNPELIIAFENHATNSTNTSASNKAIKTPAMQSLLIQKYQSALNDVKLGRPQQAISNLSALLVVDPEYQDARTTLAALLLDKGNYHQAEKVINEGLNVFPNSTAFLELKARLLTQNGQTQQALNLLQSVTPSVSENPNYHALIAALYERSNKDLLAIRVYQKLLATNSHNGSWWFGLGVSYDKLGNAREALHAYDRALAEGHLHPDSLAYLQRRLENLQEADNDKA